MYRVTIRVTFATFASPEERERDSKFSRDTFGRISRLRSDDDVNYRGRYRCCAVIFAVISRASARMLLIAGKLLVNDKRSAIGRHDACIDAFT